MNPKDPFIEDDIHDYVDGHMSADRCRRFEKFLHENPEIAEVVQSYRQQNRMLHALFGSDLARKSANNNGNGSSGDD